MNIKKKKKKIVVDELPDYCEDCDIFNDLTNECSFLDMYVSDSHKRRHEMCPLEVEEVCEWVLNYHIDNAVWDISPSCCVGEFSMNKPNYEICPNCGKRIKYVEVE